MTSPRPEAAISQRTLMFVAGLGMLAMAILAPFAEFGVLSTLIVPSDAAATANNIIASEGLFRAAIAALLVVAILDVPVAWAFYFLFRPVSETLALLVAWMRIVYTAVFAIAILNLLDSAQLLGSADSVSALRPELLQAQALSSIASFENGWAFSLVIFGLHLVGLTAMLLRAPGVPRLLGVLVLVAGGGYMVDGFGTILVPDYGLTVRVLTFVGEALLIPWLLWKAIKASPSDAAVLRTGDGSPALQPTPTGP